MERSGNFYKAIRLGYILISILIGCMAYNSLYEWQEIEALELGNKKIDELRKEINNINIQMIKFSLLGETILEWNDKDIEHYHARRMAMDSMLCRFKATYPAERIDSVRSLLEDKERQMFQIVRLMDEQQSINKKIANQIPVIVQKSVQEQSKKPKRKGFLGIFGKKKEVTPAVSTTILHSVNRNVISEQKVQDRQLSEQADSLAARNAELNRQLQELICQIEEKVQTELQSRENEIVAMREKSFMQVGGLMGVFTCKKLLMTKKKLPVRFTGQHFTIDKVLIKDAIRQANISNQDTVLDIGAGKGFLTVHLLKIANNVVAIENDTALVEHLRKLFSDARNVQVVGCDFRNFAVPKFPFKVVSNIPYGITSDIFKILMFESLGNFLGGSIVLQLEPTQKLFSRKLYNPYTVFYHTFFDLKLVYEVGPESFLPPPTVKSALLNIKRKHLFFDLSSSNASISCHS